MLDTHYDLLTKLYICYKRNDFSYIENWMKNYNQDNVNGIIANLCFMSKDEMKNEYDKDYFKDGDSVIDIFRVSISLLKKYMPNNIKVYTSIEGCDYLNNENDLVVLKELGLDVTVEDIQDLYIYSVNKEKLHSLRKAHPLTKKAIFSYVFMNEKVLSKSKGVK